MIRNADRQAFLIVTHEISKHVLKLYHKLKNATADIGDVFLLYHARDNASPVSTEGLNIETFTDDILKNLDYKPIRTTLIPGSNHFPVLNFFLAHPEYKYYWCIEDDVIFNGNWNHLFSTVSPDLNYDFITSHIRNYSSAPRWYWWDTLKMPGKEIEKKDLINSFNPIYRISSSALQYIDKCLKNGYIGHHEVLIPTILQKEGYTIADFSNKENHITPHLSFCTLRTMRWIPVFVIPGNKKNMLYHPVKAKITLNQLYVYLKRTIKNKKRYLTAFC